MMENRAKFTEEQVELLLRGINPARVLNANGNSHLANQDVEAHLIRVFGFGGFDIELLFQECLFVQEGVSQKSGKPNYSVGYKAGVRLHLRNPLGEYVTFRDNVSTGEARNQASLGAAHDLAMKSAVSLAEKRAAKSLGDQFGLSLYNRGQLDRLVIGTLVDGPKKEPDELENAGGGQKVSGDHEGGYEPPEGDDDAAEALSPAVPDELVAEIIAANTLGELEVLWERTFGDLRVAAQAQFSARKKAISERE